MIKLNELSYNQCCLLALNVLAKHGDEMELEKRMRLHYSTSHYSAESKNYILNHIINNYELYKPFMQMLLSK